MNNTVKTTILTIVNMVAAASVGSAVGNIIGAKTPVSTSPIGKLSVGFGTFIVSGVLSDLGMNYVNTQIEGIFDAIEAAKISSQTEQDSAKEKKVV